jgi:hypothetical protein
MDLSVSNSTVIIALNNSVMRLNLMNPEEIDSKILRIVGVSPLRHLDVYRCKTVIYMKGLTECIVYHFVVDYFIFSIICYASS